MSTLRVVHRLNTLLLGLTLSAAIPVAASAQITGTTEPPDGPEIELESIDLVTFQIGTLSTVEIVGVPEEDDVLMGEAVPAGGDERFLIDPSMTPAQVFARLAPRDTPVPRMIADHDAAGLLAGRPVVEKLDKPIEVSPALFGIFGASSAKARIATKSNGGSCQQGNAGADYFESHHCGSWGGPGYGSSESYCDSTATNNFLRTASSKRRATYSRLASCGTGTNRFIHYYHHVGGWTRQVTRNVEAPFVKGWWSSRTGLKKNRRVRFEEIDATGWVRGWSIFWSEVAGGW